MVTITGSSKSSSISSSNTYNPLTGIGTIVNPITGTGTSYGGGTKGTIIVGGGATSGGGGGGYSPVSSSTTASVGAIDLEAQRRLLEQQRQQLEAQRLSQLQEYQRQAITREREAYRKAGLQQPNISQQQEYYGQRTNLTPTQAAYYGKIESGEITPKGTSKIIKADYYTVDTEGNKLAGFTGVPNKILYKLQKPLNVFNAGIEDFYPQENVTQQISPKIKARVERAIARDIKIGEVLPFLKSMTERDITRQQAYLNSKGQTYQEEYRDYLRSSNLSDLYSKKDYPAMIIKSSDILGGKAFEFIQKNIGQRFFKEPALTPQVKTQVGEMIGETALFSGFSPFMKTSGQIYKEISIPRNDVAFAGVNQQLGRTEQGTQVIKTELDFLTSQGKKGTATGITELTRANVPLRESTFLEGAGKIRNYAEVTAFKTNALGEIGGVKGVKFPTGKIIYSTEKFTGADIGLAKEFENRFVSVSKGATAEFKIGSVFPKGNIKLKTAPLNFYQSMGVGAQKEDLTAIFGGSFGQKAAGKFGGIIRDTDIININLKDIVSPLIKARGGTSSVISNPALQSTASIIKATVKTIPKTSFASSVFASSSKVLSSITTRELPSMVGGKGLTTDAIYSGTGLYERTEGGITPKTSLGTTIRTRQSPLYLPLQSESELLKSGLKSQQVLKEESLLRHQQKSLTVQKEESLLRHMQKTMQTQKQIQRQKNILSLGFPKTITKSMFFPILKLGKGSVFKSTSRLYTTSIRRFGKWKPYAKAPTLKGAFNLGKLYTTRTLGASFKISKGTGQIPYAPSGYYAKQEKGQTIFIEKRGRRLKKGTLEIPEIQMFRKQKMPRVRTKRKGRRK